MIVEIFFDLKAPTKQIVKLRDKLHNSHQLKEYYYNIKVGFRI